MDTKSVQGITCFTSRKQEKTGFVDYSLNFRILMTPDENHLVYSAIPL